MRTLLALEPMLLLTGVASAMVPEPDGFWRGPMHGETPNSVKRASVIDTQALVELRARERPVLLDLAAADQRPSSMSRDILWLPIHRSIPGTAWFPGAGGSSTDTAFERVFKQRIRALANGDLDIPIVVFCHPQCWASWNASKRLVALGYHYIYWYSEGLEGWRDRYGTEAVKADPAWVSALSRVSKYKK
jgi:PQQ-dependent catabolism-associated CXXCW motif protein